MLFDYLWLALFFPALGFLYCAILGARFPSRWAGYVGSGAIGISFIVVLVRLFSLLGLPESSRIKSDVLYTWFAGGDLVVPMGLLIDPLSITMGLVVTGVGFVIHVYSTGYMSGDDGYVRFFAYMNLFILSMLALVLANNYVMLLIGWGGVGLCSYLLIAFWFQRREAAAAGIKAFVVNAIGDVGLMLATFLMIVNFGAIEYAKVFESASDRPSGDGLITAITLLLLLGAVAKSAQLPLYVWLPDAMAGPTPVSALIHAATMVTAGVYLIARSHPLFELAPLTMTTIAIIGALTALFAATIGAVKTNIKRVLAYSTVSQLGYMTLALGVGAFGAGLFHLVTHAFFKALLFLAAGAVIHALAGEEEMERMGGLRSRLPLVYWTFLIGALALIGFPLFSGFFSKDEIIAAAFFSENGSWVLGVIAVLTSGITGYYVFRAFFLTFHGQSRVPDDVAAHLHRPGLNIYVPLIVLAAFSAIAGFIQVPGATSVFESFLHPTFAGAHQPEIGGGGYWLIAAASAVVAVAGLGLAYSKFGKSRPVSAEFSSGGWLRKLLLNDYYVEHFYRLVFVRPVYWLGNLISIVADPLIVDGVVRGFYIYTRASARILGTFQTGYARTYLVVIVAGAVLIVAYAVRVGI